MNSFLKTVIISGLMVPMLSTDAATPAPQTRPAKIDYREHYSVLSERNMFLRDRRRSSFSRGPESRPAYVARPVDETLILTGVVFEEGEYRAYFEDTVRASVLRLRVGESVGRGVITQIQMDAIEYLNGEQHVWIDVGRTLTGSVPPPSPIRTYADTTPAVTAPGSTTQPSMATGVAPSPLPNPTDPNLTLEERMKLRRAQELNR